MPPGGRRINRITCAAACALLTLPVLATTAGATTGSPTVNPKNDTLAGLPAAPGVTAPAWAVYDGTDDTLLAGHGAEVPRPIASLTKLMTALLVTEKTTGDETVTASKAAQDAGDGSEIDMTAGQRYPVDVLLQAMLAYSANDAAVALAEYVGGSEDAFIEQMNTRAKELHLAHTTYTTVNGLDAPTLTESSPADLVQLAMRDMRDQRFRSAVSTHTVVVDRPGDTTVKLDNRNQLVGTVPGVDGIKTGFTDSAGYCLITHWKDPSGGPGELYVVVLGEPARDDTFTDTRQLLAWGAQLRRRLLVADAGSRIADVPVHGSDHTARVYVEDDIRPWLRIGTHLTERVNLPQELAPPLRSGDVVGTYTLLADGKPVAHSNLYVAHDLRQPTRLERLRAYAHGWRDASREGWRYTRHEGSRFMEYWGME